MTSWEEFTAREEVRGFSSGYLYVVWTDRQPQIEKWTLNEEKQSRMAKHMDKVLEIRLFDKDSEFRIFRTALGKAFYERLISDEGRDVIEERQYLDIDSAKSVVETEEHQYLDIDSATGAVEKGITHVTATGGGRYDLPFVCGADQRIIIKNYISYHEETGQAYVSDFRLAGFEGKEA